MSQLGTSTYKALYGSTGTIFPDNTIEEISEGDLRQFGEDNADSFINKTDSLINSSTFSGASSSNVNSAAATKTYIDNQVTSNLSGLAWKAPVKAKTTAALAANTVGGGDTTLTANANGAFPSQDGVTINLNDSILVANESTGSKNGIYTLSQVGSAGTPWILTRRSDNDSTSEMQNAVVSVDQGTANADTSWRQSADSVTVGSTSVTWVIFGAAQNIASVVSVGNDTSGTTITGLPTPSASSDAATKGYVDTQFALNAWQIVEVSVSSSDILNLFSTPKQLVASPGTGYGVIVSHVVFRQNGSTAYATNTTMRVYLGSVSTPVIADVTNVLNSGLTNFIFSATANDYGNTTSSGNHIYLTVLTGNPTTGNRTLKVEVVYRIVQST